MAEVTITRERGASSLNAVSSSRARKSPLEMIKNFDKEYRVTAKSEERGASLSLSNYGFGLSESLRRTKYPFLESSGVRYQKQAVMYEMAKNVSKGAQAVADALNKSGLSRNSWSVAKSKPITLRYTSGTNNSSVITIKKR